MLFLFAFIKVYGVNAVLCHQVSTSAIFFVCLAYPDLVEILRVQDMHTFVTSVTDVEASIAPNYSGSYIYIYALPCRLHGTLKESLAWEGKMGATTLSGAQSLWTESRE